MQPIWTFTAENDAPYWLRGSCPHEEKWDVTYFACSLQINTKMHLLFDDSLEVQMRRKRHVWKIIAQGWMKHKNILTQIIWGEKGSLLCFNDGSDNNSKHKANQICPVMKGKGPIISQHYNTSETTSISLIFSELYFLSWLFHIKCYLG